MDGETFNGLRYLWNERGFFCVSTEGNYLKYLNNTIIILYREIRLELNKVPYIKTEG